MIDMHNLGSREPRLPVEAVIGFGEQCLELVVPENGTPLAESREELVFYHPDGVGNLEPTVLTGFVEQFMPSGNTEPFVRGWGLTAGQVASVHAYWKVGHDPNVTLAVTQIRGQVINRVQQAVKLQVHMTGVIDKEVDGMDIMFGDIDEQGSESGPIVTLVHEELSGSLSPGKSRAVTDLVDGVRSVLTLAEIHIQPERQPRPSAT